jgi:hypothetical protein
LEVPKNTTKLTTTTSFYGAQPPNNNKFHQEKYRESNFLQNLGLLTQA